MANLRACGCGAAFLPHRRSQKFCSRRCAALARPPRPSRPRCRRAEGQPNPFVLRLLDIQPLERRARGGWRFGTRRISDGVADRLIASGRAEIRGSKLHSRQTEAT
ncbi:hypothetical protein [Bradyrhizobium diazoefficiens]|uniref:Uncharacterized protein n=1 Tax=Bradyrhizobium diazoefficiens TaxID=1355477 RepID=A0A809YP85_9BRAD|nr:hypothetical protein [Bradyrhizobium diazoefficiens]BCA04162.1 hypothetical protein H12S4_50660 [Bradyrhizobium diazoefficiens]BCA21519.1 hypothetical protein BDHH15_47340 [Bradyrhizobium diazoefficiens]BCE39688.1 hypothetical protein XF3B_47190 [Bradyrhizobium diazoefficiens]BCF53084.1 hypothetical protein XF17B_47220 [Bradyrhizobium diazoefficiens]